MSRTGAISLISLKLSISMYFWSLKPNLEEFFVGRRYFGDILKKKPLKNGSVSMHTLYNAKQDPFH